MCTVWPLEQLSTASAMFRFTTAPRRTSRVDAGEASCARLATDHGAAFLITDDLRALPEPQQLTGAQVTISPILLRALVKRGCLTGAEASERLERLAADRDWLGAPIYRRAQRLFES